MAKTAVILSGCGVYDGSEIHESTLTLLALAKAGKAFQCLAPNITQAKVVDHAVNAEMLGDTRSVLQESARIARGEITALEEADAADYDSIIVPGGFGAALNLCDFAVAGAECTVNPAVASFVKNLHAQQKPLGFMCIAPVMVNRILEGGVRVTIGQDAAIAEAIRTMGGEHENCNVRRIVLDEENKVVTTPAYMLAQNLVELNAGIEALVTQVCAWVS